MLVEVVGVVVLVDVVVVVVEPPDWPLATVTVNGLVAPSTNGTSPPWVVVFSSPKAKPDA